MASVSTEKVAPAPKRKSMDWPPQLFIPWVPGVLLGQELVWGPLGTFSPDCLESLTPETYASEGSLSSRVVLCRPDIEPGRLRCLRSIPLEVPLLSTVIASLFTWVPLGIFLRLFKNDSDTHYKGFCLFLCLFLPFFLFLLFPTIIDCSSHLQQNI